MIIYLCGFEVTLQPLILQTGFRRKWDKPPL